MKQKRNRLIPIILLLAILFTSTVYADDVSLDSSPVDEIKTSTETEMAATLAEMKRIQEIEAPALKDHVLLQSSLTMNPSMSSTYAGAYLNEDKNLVILSTVLDEETIAFYRNATRNTDILVYKAKYTLDELKEKLYEYHERILQLAEYPSGSKERNTAENITELAIDEEYNCIIVKLKNIAKAEQSQFKEFVPVDDMCVVFETGSTIEKYVGIYPGQGIKWFSGNTPVTGSVGFRAIQTLMSGTMTSGFTTAGHVFYVGGYSAPAGTAVYSYNPNNNSSEQIGYYRNAYAPAIGNADIAYIEQLSDATTYNTVHNTNVTLVAGQFLDTPQESTVYLCGVHTRNVQLRVDRIWSISYDIDNDGNSESISDVYSCTLLSGQPYPGDSGGVVYGSATGASPCRVLGTLIGGHSSNVSDIYVSKLMNSCNALNLSPY